MDEQQCQSLNKNYQDTDRIEGKIKIVCDGLTEQVRRKLRSVTNPWNVVNISNYVIAMKTESNLSDSYRIGII